MEAFDRDPRVPTALSGAKCASVTALVFGLVSGVLAPLWLLGTETVIATLTGLRFPVLLPIPASVAAFTAGAVLAVVGAAQLIRGVNEDERKLMAGFLFARIGITIAAIPTILDGAALVAAATSLGGGAVLAAVAVAHLGIGGVVWLVWFKHGETLRHLAGKTAR